MATYSKLVLSGSTEGKAVKVTGNATGNAVTVHTASSVATTLDEVWIYANNTTASDVKLTVEWGTATAEDGNIEYTVKAENGLYLLVPGLILKGNTSSQLTVKAFAATANAILLTGYVNRIEA
jgi:hypothetical protein